MTTQVFQPAPASDPEGVYRQRLRTAILIVFVVTLVFGLFYSTGDFRAASGPHRGGWLFIAVLEFVPGPLLYLFLWWRLSSPDARIPVGIAIGEAAELLFRVLQRVLAHQAEVPPPPAIFRLYRPVILILFLAVGGLAVATSRSFKDRRALVALGIPLGWYFDTIVRSVVGIVVEIMKLGNGL
jgi:hypothetical protein